MKSFRMRKSSSVFTSADILGRLRGLVCSEKYRSIASLSELDDRAPFKIAGAIVNVEKKFTRRDGKPFAVVWLEDLTQMLEVVVWNEVYLKVSDALVSGRVIEIKGTLDKREEVLRATATEIDCSRPAKLMGEGTIDRRI